MSSGPRLLATSDLHVNRSENESLVQDLHPTHPGDWLIVAGDVGDRVATTTWALGILAERFARVIWVPGNHELWTPPGDEVDLVGPARYDHLVKAARDLGVLTPEDPWPMWDGAGGPVLVCPMFLLYDYSVRPPAIPADWSNEAALEVAREAGVVATDEILMSSDPFPDAAAWCADRVAITEARLAERPAGMPTVLVNHWPLTPEPTRILRYPEFSLWCGTTASADWHVRHDAVAVVYGHLHIPRTTEEDGVRFEEVSVGYPREWQRHGLVRGALREILPGPADDGPDPFTAWAAERSARWARS
jgi:3',5'-cyclic AMP phosphodiesterase CpdA